MILMVRAIRSFVNEASIAKKNCDESRPKRQNSGEGRRKRKAGTARWPGGAFFFHSDDQFSLEAIFFILFFSWIVFGQWRESGI